jgi:predicted transcriptional regulator
MSRAVEKSLGELQALVLSILWDSATPLSVRDVLSRVKRKPLLAYTTVLTVLTRLHEQDLVVREKEGKAYFYRPRVSREQWMGERAARELAVPGGPPDQAVLAAFLDSAERADPDLVDRLSALIAARRRRRSQ